MRCVAIWTHVSTVWAPPLGLVVLSRNSVAAIIEREHDPSRETQIVLIVCLREGIAETRQKVVDLGRPERYFLADGNVHATPEVHRKCLGGGGLGDCAVSSKRPA